VNIRAKIFGGVVAAEEPLLRPKKPKGATSDTLNSVTVPREAVRLSNGRGKDRHRLTNEQARITHKGSEIDVELINVSGGGAMIAGAFEPMLWDRVELHLGANGRIEAAVRWIGKGRVGLEFAQETHLEGPANTVAEILRQVIERTFPDMEFDVDDDVGPIEAEPEARDSSEEHRAARRHPLIWTGVLHHDYQSSPVRIRNISATGAMIQTDTAVRVGAEPLLELGDDVSISATVEWAVGDQVGLSFHSPFDMSVLTESRPTVAGGKWAPPRYLDLRGEQVKDQDHWQRLTVPELRTELESFLKR
jgi:hypothetical protein